MGNNRSHPYPDYEIVLSGFFRNTNPSLILPLCIIEKCIQFCCKNYLSYLLLCIGSKDYSFPQFNGIRILNLQNKKIHYLTIHDLNQKPPIYIHNKVSFDGGMFTKCHSVSNIKLPHFITNTINNFQQNKFKRYDAMFRFGRFKETQFDLIAFNTTFNNESKDINAFRISLPSLSPSRIEQNIIYNKYNDTLYCSALQKVEYLDAQNIPFLYSLKLKQDMIWNEIGICRKERNSLCIIGDHIEYELLMIGSNAGSHKAFIYDFNSNKYNELWEMNHSRKYPGIYYDAFDKKTFVAEGNIVEIYDINKNEWNVIGKKTKRYYYQNPSVWTHCISRDIVFVAGKTQKDDKERVYLQDLGFCEWIDLRSQRKWNILHKTDLLTLFKFDDMPSHRNIFTRSILPIFK